MVDQQEIVSMFADDDDDDYVDGNQCSMELLSDVKFRQCSISLPFHSMFCNCTHLMVFDVDQEDCSTSEALLLSITQ